MDVTLAGQTPTLAPSPPVERESQLYVASQWQLMWWRFSRHKLALASGVVVIGIYLVAIFAEFIAPYAPDVVNARYLYAPPQPLHLFSTEGGFHFAPHVFGYKSVVDAAAGRRNFTVDETQVVPVGLFVQGSSYQLLGFIPWDRHLIGPVQSDQPMYLLGADRLGGDMFSNTVYGTRISMSIGLVGVTLSLILGVLLGGISGYYGGAIDTVIQRVIEFLRSIPTIPLWMGLAAALPTNWPPLRIYFGITIILSLIGWTGLARVVRGRFLAMRTEEFVTAAELDGASDMRIILRYMAPSFASHIIAATTLAIPAMIISETSLSFLGLGLQPPLVSWGTLLKEAQSVRSILQAPWQLWPAAAVVVAVLALNFLGDGLRDAADPYA
ncbi:MAG: ABC transporter permease [Chloroflexi bacterium]|nr:ABC transporter permease [Chloroflexota bacterium]MBV9134415.1 ABC transporter permease [Chloroflexota bacterium]